MSVESVMPSNYLILHRPLHLLPPIPPSINIFLNESALCIRWPKFWTFNFCISLSNKYSGLISFRMDWLDPLELQGTLKCFLQHQSSKASILRHSLCHFSKWYDHLYSCRSNKQTFKKIISLYSCCLCLHLIDQQTLLNIL